MSPKAQPKSKMKAAPAPKLATPVKAAPAAKMAKTAAPALAKTMAGAPKKGSGKGAPAAAVATPAVDPGMIPAFAREEAGVSAVPSSLKNYRNHPDMENFFRFIYENDLRIEALQIINEILTTRQARKKKGDSDSKVHA